ncbi:MAG: MBOAT family protein, partial [Oscillospiraceae bacterium]|nr:MBOAT family protein [Oscillospiraceae bacterium]
MNFNSLEFLLFFPVVFILHWTLPHRFRWVLLLAASWMFYFWWNPWTGLLLVGTTLVSWLCARGIARTEQTAIRRALLVLALAVSLGCLGFFKYTGFFASLVGLELSIQIILPVGISFYTFQTLSYVIDVYRGGVEPEGHFGYYALFVSFFPQLVAGPIERPENLLPQLRAERTLRAQNLTAGGWLLLEGYFKKIVVADTLAPYVDRVFGVPEAALGPEIVLATLLFGIQIYCDFSGYSSIARGTAALLGIDLMENFRRPYGARTVRELWRKWHISLTSWFTDYVYIPLGGSRRGLPRQVVNILIVFLLSGLWHGAGWTFVLWGLIHGLYQVGGVLLERGRSSPPRAG